MFLPWNCMRIAIEISKVNSHKFCNISQCSDAELDVICRNLNVCFHSLKIRFKKFWVILKCKIKVSGLKISNFNHDEWFPFVYHVLQSYVFESSIYKNT